MIASSRLSNWHESGPTAPDSVAPESDDCCKSMLSQSVTEFGSTPLSRTFFWQTKTAIGIAGRRFVFENGAYSHTVRLISILQTRDTKRSLMVDTPKLFC